MADSWDIASKIAAWFAAGGTLVNAWFNYRKYIADTSKDLPLVIWETERKDIWNFTFVVTVSNTTPRPIFLNSVTRVSFGDTLIALQEVQIDGEAKLEGNPVAGADHLNLLHTRIPAASKANVIFRCHLDPPGGIEGVLTEFVLEVDLGLPVDRNHSFMFSRKL